MFTSEYPLQKPEKNTTKFPNFKEALSRLGRTAMIEDWHMGPIYQTMGYNMV